MKIFITLLFSLFSVSAMSCPIFSGTYVCPLDSNDPNDKGVIAVRNVDIGYRILDKDNGKVSYLPADHKKYSTSNGGTYMGWCKGRAHLARVTGKNSAHGPFTAEIATTLQNGNWNQSGKIKYEFGEFPFSTTCKRK